MRDAPVISEKLILKDGTSTKTNAKPISTRRKSVSKTKVRSHKLSFIKKTDVLSTGNSKSKLGSPSPSCGVERIGQRKTLQTLQPSASHSNVLVGKHSSRKLKSCEKQHVQKQEPKVTSSTSSQLQDLESLLGLSESSSCVKTDPKQLLDNEETTSDDDIEDLPSDDESAKLAQEALALMVEDPPADMYWQTVAEERRIALQETLEENEQLYNQVETLQKRCRELEERTKQAEHYEQLYKKLCKEQTS